MSKNNIDHALSALADTLKGIEQDSSIDYKEISRKIPLRSLTGNHINGGTILNFASTGISDTASTVQLTVADTGVYIPKLKVDCIENLTVTNVLKAKIIEVDEIRADIKFEKNVPIVFASDKLDGIGMMWTGKGNTKQFVFTSTPDRFFSSESIDLARGKSISVNGMKLFDEQGLGPMVVHSNLQQLGRLTSLVVDGDVSIGEYINFSNITNRLGLGTEDPNAALSIVDNGIEVILGTLDFNKGIVGTYASHPFAVVTDNTSRISITAGGDITLGNANANPIKVSVVGSLGINVNTIDPRAEFQVKGAIKFNNKLHLSNDYSPIDGIYTEGDVVWNSKPQPGRFVGWVCTKAGSPGIWNGFGRIE
jgi:hypothetical protein